jgi:transcriptional regulator with XRE-family HTH domain
MDVYSDVGQTSKAMKGAAKRVRELRERTGKSADDLARLLGMSPMSYFDIEFHDDELESVPSLRQVRELAMRLGVSAVELVTGSTTDVNERIRWPDLVSRTLDYRRTAGVTENVFEDLVGWKLGDFFASEDAMLDNYTVDFLKELCKKLQISWVHALP